MGKKKKIWVSLTPLFNMIKKQSRSTETPELHSPSTTAHYLSLFWRVVAIKREENAYE